MNLLKNETPILKSPFPYFGGKLHASKLIWEHLGTDIKNYVEPFFGSGAVFFNRPEELEQHGWQKKVWHKIRGYQGADDRERIWFSPHCLNLEAVEDNMALGF